MKNWHLDEEKKSHNLTLANGFIFLLTHLRSLSRGL